jgi:hypothetical protein
LNESLTEQNISVPILSIKHDISTDIVITSNPISGMSRYCIFRYRVIMTRYRVIFHDIGPDIVNFCADIVTISCHTRSLPYTIFFISCPISCFFPISDTMSGQYRDIPVSCHTRYRVFHRYHARYGPDIAINIRIYRCRVQKNTMSLPMCMQYHNIPMSGTSDVGFSPIWRTTYHLLRLHLRSTSRRSNRSSLLVISSADQKGSALGTAYILEHSMLLQKKARV